MNLDGTAEERELEDRPAPAGDEVEDGPAALPVDVTVEREVEHALFPLIVFLIMTLLLLNS